MSRVPKPKPPKPCPVCQVAMQSRVGAHGTVHACQQCGLTVTIKTPPAGAADFDQQS